MEEIQQKKWKIKKDFKEKKKVVFAAWHKRNEKTVEDL